MSRAGLSGLMGSSRKHMNSVMFENNSNYLYFPTPVTSSTGKVLFSCWSLEIGPVFAEAGGTFFVSAGLSTPPYFIGQFDWFFGGNFVMSDTSSGTTYYQINSQPTTFDHNSGRWRHVLFSSEFNHAAGAKLGKMFIDGVDCTNLALNTAPSMTNFEVKYVMLPSPGDKFFMAEYYLTDEYLDLSNPANVAKFYNNGRAVDLGADGSTPTGTQPLIYLKGNAANIHVNSGSAGNLSVNGTPRDANSSPMRY